MTEIVSKRKKSTVSAKLNNRYNHKETLTTSLTTPVKGKDGLYVAVREAVNNAFDAKATEIKIYFATGNEPILGIDDNGVGFDQKGTDSAMSYAFSARQREDITTIGANGTGLKSFIGLGSVENNLLTLYSVSRELPNCTKMEIDFEYLLALAEKKPLKREYVREIKIPKNWLDHMKRTTGTTVHYTGFDGRKMKSMTQMINEFGSYITPKALPFIRVRDDNGGWQHLAEPIFDGKKYEFSFETKGLGNVIFEVYYGGSGDGPKICGAINEILPFIELYNKMSKEQKKQVSKIWKSTSGHIYLQNANIFRTHDGSFSDAFYQSDACTELVELMGVVSEEVEKLANQEREEELLRKKQILINRIIEAGRIISPPKEISQQQISQLHQYDRPFLGIGQVDQDIYILPRGLNLFPNEKVSITLNNRGKQVVSFNNATWHIEGSHVELLKQSNEFAEIKAGTKLGRSTVIIEGSFGVHRIEIIVSTNSIKPFISGPSYIRPGNVITYMLQRHQDDRVEWFLLDAPKEVRRQNTSNLKTFVLEVDQNCPECSIVIGVREQGKEQVLAQKKVNILDSVRNQPPLISIAGYEYLLVIGTYFPETIAQVDYFYEDEIVPKIVFNPLHSRIKDIGFFYSLDHVLAAIGNAAMIDQVSRGNMKATLAASEVEKFIDKFKEQILKQKR